MSIINFHENFTSFNKNDFVTAHILKKFNMGTKNRFDELAEFFVIFKTSIEIVSYPNKGAGSS